jgi:hypothetical protein
MGFRAPARPPENSPMDAMDPSTRTSLEDRGPPQRRRGESPTHLPSVLTAVAAIALIVVVNAGTPAPAAGAAAPNDATRQSAPALGVPAASIESPPRSRRPDRNAPPAGRS